MPPRRAPQHGRVGDRQEDLLFRDTLLCETGPHRIAALSDRISDCKHTLFCRGRAGTTHELRYCSAGCVCTTTATKHCHTVLQAVCTPRTPTHQAHYSPDPALSRQSLPDHAHCRASTCPSRLTGRADSNSCFLVSSGWGLRPPLSPPRFVIPLSRSFSSIVDIVGLIASGSPHLMPQHEGCNIGVSP